MSEQLIHANVEPPNGAPWLMILDLSLGNGFDLLRKIRSRSNVPVIITNGDRGDEIDPVAGLELGADDYVTKPSACWRVCAPCCGGMPGVLHRRATAADSAAGGSIGTACA
jgi:DNA-binding response OmpR family regulator